MRSSADRPLAWAGRWLAAVALWAAAGAAFASDTLPEGYDGPVAAIHDSIARAAGAPLAFYMVTRMGGLDVDNSLRSSRLASQGQGMRFTVLTLSRDVPAGRSLVLTLEGQTAYAAPIAALFNASKVRSVARTVSFTPETNHRYVVRGTLGESERGVWLEDLDSGDRPALTDVAVPQ